MALFSFISLLCSLRSNIPNVIMFLFLLIQYCLLAGYNWSQAEGKDAIAARIGEVRLIYIRTLNNLSFMLTDYLI
jgi:succinate-acetate transporter protein